MLFSFLQPQLFFYSLPFFFFSLSLRGKERRGRKLGRREIRGNFSLTQATAPKVHLAPPVFCPLAPSPLVLRPLGRWESGCRRVQRGGHSSTRAGQRQVLRVAPAGAGQGGAGPQHLSTAGTVQKKVRMAMVRRIKFVCLQYFEIS